jgi:hypothetical protein
MPFILQTSRSSDQETPGCNNSPKPLRIQNLTIRSSVHLTTTNQNVQSPILHVLDRHALLRPNLHDGVVEAVHNDGVVVVEAVVVVEEESVEEEEVHNHGEEVVVGVVGEEEVDNDEEEVEAAEVEESDGVGEVVEEVVEEVVVVEEEGEEEEEDDDHDKEVEEEELAKAMNDHPLVRPNLDRRDHDVERDVPNCA